MADDEDVPEGENPFAAEGGAGGEGGDKTKSESAYEKKGWISEDRDYQYGEVSSPFMLERAHKLNYDDSCSAAFTACCINHILRCLEALARRDTLSHLPACTGTATSDQSLPTLPTFAKRCTGG